MREFLLEPAMAGRSQLDQVRRMGTQNVDGVMNTIPPALPLMQKRRKGQIGIVSSMAGFRGFPGAPAYCGSKAAIKVLGKGWPTRQMHRRVRYLLGYIRSPMTAVNSFPMPSLMQR